MGFTFIESDISPVLADFDRWTTFALDIETTGLNPLDSRILLVQIGFPGQQYVIDARTADVSPLAPYWTSNKWKKILFNAKFDGQFLLHNFGYNIHNIFDCMIAEKVLHPEQKGGMSFEDLALKYLNVHLNKNVRKTFFGKIGKNFTEDQIKYSAEDVNHLFDMMELQIKELEKTKLTHIADLEFEVIPAVAEMELTGVPVNKTLWREVLAAYTLEHEEARKKVLSVFLNQPIEDFSQQMGLFGDGLAIPSNHKEVNINSPQQLRKMFADIGIHVAKTDEQTISVIQHPAAEALMEYRKLQKIMTSYGEKSVLDKVHPFSGRIHPSWWQLGTETGRFACSDPNLQQIPARFREAMGGAEDLVLVGADFSQMELRILAEESKDPILVEAFTTGKDIHSVTATNMFDIKLEDVTKEQRFAAKTLNFGITYGMKVKKFVDMMNAEALKDGRPTINIKQGRDMLAKYRETYKVASRYLEQVGLQALRDGKTQTRFGRKRFFTPVSTSLDPDSYRGALEAIKRQGANMPIQGTNADITKMAMVTLYHDLKDYGYRGNIILQVHDEIVILAHKSHAEPIRELLVTAMEEAGKSLLPTIPVVVDSYVSDYWSK